MRSGWREPPWFGRPVGRILFLRELEDLEGVRTAKDARYPGGFCVVLRLRILGLPPREVKIVFPRTLPEVPQVWVDGPTESPHRYTDGTLCMWYPKDSPAKRWVRADGAAELITRIAAHLIREEWYRKTGDWRGEEIAHGPADPLNDPIEARAEHGNR
jgi:hypothetical protein